MFTRRIDLVIFATSYDLKDISKPYSMKGKEPRDLTPEKLRTLIHFRWNLRDDQVVISEEVNRRFLDQPQRLAEKFGKPDEVPVVCPQDFRKTFARLCVALAMIDILSEDDFQTIVVKGKHLRTMPNFVNHYE